MNLGKRTVVASAALLATAGLLAACGGSSSSGSATPSVLPSSSPSTAAVGTTPGTWAPISVTTASNGKRVHIVVGQAVVFDGLPANDKTNKIVLVAAKHGVVKLHQQSSAGGVVTKPGLTGLAPGKTRITVYDGDPKSKSATVVMYIHVNVTAASSASAAASPAMS